MNCRQLETGRSPLFKIAARFESTALVRFFFWPLQSGWPFYWWPMELASLQIAIDSRQTKTAKEWLDELTGAGARAEKAMGGVGAGGRTAAAGNTAAAASARSATFPANGPARLARSIDPAHTFRRRIAHRFAQQGGIIFSAKKARLVVGFLVLRKRWVIAELNRALQKPANPLEFWCPPRESNTAPTDYESAALTRHELEGRVALLIKHQIKR